MKIPPPFNLGTNSIFTIKNFSPFVNYDNLKALSVIIKETFERMCP